jgi:hypothetical protein
MSSIQNLTLSRGIVLDTNGQKIKVIVDGYTYGPAYDLAAIQERMQKAITQYDELYIAAERAKPNPDTALIASAIKTQERLKRAISLLNPNGPADQAIKADNAAEAAARKARGEPDPPPPPPPPTPPPPAPTPPPSPTANAAVVTSNAAPTTSTGTATKAPLTGAASDDSGAKQANPAGSTGAPSSTPAGSATGTNTPAPNSPTQPNNSSPEAQSTGPALRTQASKTQPPGKRLKNPLGYFSSYNYQLSLYMITPDAYDAFIQSGRKDINAFSQLAGAENGGAYLIAQSGGINNQDELRAPGFGFDYSIDNLSFDTITSGKAGEGDTNTTSIKFTITEPYGFSFVSNLRKAQEALEAELKKNNKSIKVELPKNPTKQFFILGIRFYGYDEVGNLLKGTEMFDSNTLDPTAPGNGAVFQRYYDIILTDMKFKIDGKAVTYNISAASLAPAQAFGIKRGQVDTNINIEASDVETAINKLMEKLNQRQKELHKGSKNPELCNTYKVKFLGEAATVIGKSKIVSPADLDKFKWAGSGAKKTADANDKTATKSQTPDNTKTTITISGSPATPIPAAISTIITQSQFLEQGLKTVYTTSLEPPKDKSKMNQIDQSTKKVLKWYNCSSQLANARWNPDTKDWVYDITYIIQIYETPIIDSAYANVTSKYYGPHKRYNYWYTGQNSEVISYVQELNNAYFTVTVAPQDGNSTSDTENPSTDGTSTGESGNGQKGTPADTPAVPGKASEQSTEGKVGAAAKATQNSYITSLFDPASQAEAKIQILGDPDFIMMDSGYSEEQLYKKFYGADGFTINPNGGQVFVEIDFKEAVDYSSDAVSSTAPDPSTGGITGAPGTLSINESILFWDYPKDVAELVKGISYEVLKVTSQFSGGSFKQTLDCRINTFAESAKPTQGEGREPAANNSTQPAGTAPAAGTKTATGNSTSASNATNADSGLKTDPSTKLSTNKSIISASTALPASDIIVVTATRGVPTNLGIVVDDDATGPITTNRFLNASLTDAGRPPKIELPGSTLGSLGRVDLPGGTTGRGTLPGSSPIIRGIDLPGAPSPIRGII